jgi:divalent metal cation (Fe/Co/Zn/Cd) transporter
MTELRETGIRAAQLGILVNGMLALTKLLAGMVENSDALVARSWAQAVPEPCHTDAA